jgi:hypothetical protein
MFSWNQKMGEKNREKRRKQLQRKMDHAFLNKLLLTKYRTKEVRGNRGRNSAMNEYGIG